MKLNWKYTVAWIIWILGFGVIEWKAMKNDKGGDTLSEHVWKVAGTKTQKKSWLNWSFRIGLGAGFVWLIQHFYTGGSIF